MKCFLASPGESNQAKVFFLF